MSAIARRIAFLSVLAGAVFACSSDSDAPPSAPSGGSSATAGTGAVPSASGAGGSAAGTSAGGSVSGGPSGGTGAGGSSAGGAGTNAGGESAGAAGANMAGAAGSGGGGFWGQAGPKKQYACPAGPFPEQSLGQAETVCEGFDYAYNYLEGPTWIATEGAFFFSNFPIGQYTGGDIIKFTPGGDCEVWLEDVGCNGLGFSPSGNLLAACQGPRAVMEYDVKTKQGRTIATMADGKMLDSPNDLIARSDGNVYFSNRTAELGNRPKGLGEGLVRIDPLGAISVIQMGGLNGVALSPDETKLHVVKMGTWTLDAAGLPGQKGGPTPEGDGVAVDCAGNITWNGTNSAFGGADLKTLFIVGPGTETHTRSATVPGIP
ncbi:MAG: gnl1 [Polyangiaceae bacterium]|jgi:gluconolactonase|nr:gnl1 [Polyangiaceae bacterium]